ncbi:hypothetical protein [Spirosoma litoris]
MKWLSGFLIVGTTLFSACKSSDATPYPSVSVGLHQSARIGTTVIVRADSIQDSRCPTGLVCIWGGEAKVKLLLSTATDSSAVRLKLGAGANRTDSTTTVLDNTMYKVLLLGVNPYPSYPSTNEAQTATVQLTKL